MYTKNARGDVQFLSRHSRVLLRLLRMEEILHHGSWYLDDSHYNLILVSKLKHQLVRDLVRPQVRK